MALCCLSVTASAYDVQVGGIYYDLDPETRRASVTHGDEPDYTEQVIIPSTIKQGDVIFDVTSIGSSAFADCESLSSVSIPSSVSSIEDHAFAGCTSLYTIAIPMGVTQIASYTFSGCTSLSSAGLPSSVTSIGTGAFSGCESLASIQLPSGVKYIGVEAFSGCTLFTSITLPASVEVIYDFAFANCENLTEVHCFATSVPKSYVDSRNSDPAYSFFDGSNIENATLYVPSSAIETYRTTEPWSDFGTILAYDAELERCATPTFRIVGGRVLIESVTPGAKYHYSLTLSGTTGNDFVGDGKLILRSTYTLAAYATADGYAPSEIATTAVNLGMAGDLNVDGDVDVEDVTMLVNMILKEGEKP